MSKSLGNIVNPLDLIDEYGVDAVRYYLMREMVLGQDANFSVESFVKRYNSDLANDFGNLLNRLSGLIQKYFEGRIPECGDLNDADKDLQQQINATEEKVKTLVNDMKIHEALEVILQIVRQANKYMESQAPWKEAKTDLARAGTILYTAAEVLRVSAILLSPVMPAKTKAVLQILQAGGTQPQWGGLKSGQTISSHDALFPRLELAEKEE